MGADDVTRSGRVRATARGGVAAVVAAALGAVVPLLVGAGGPAGLQLVSGTAFTITSAVFASPACSGPPAELYPGTVRCAVLTVHNALGAPITVQSVTAALASGYPAPPAVCTGADLKLPTFSGAVTVPPAGTVALPGVPIELLDSGTDQDACQHITYHFVYSGTARYTDTTATALRSSPDPSNEGTPARFTATVTATDAGVDPVRPTGTVEFSSCATAACTATTLLGTAPVDPSDGRATFVTASLPVGTTVVEAVYRGSGTDFAGSTSPPVRQVVTTALLPPPACRGRYSDVIADPEGPFVLGTWGNDLIRLRHRGQVALGLGGDDCLWAGDGDDVLLDGNGTDAVVAGNGNDVVVLTIQGGNHDVVLGGAGTDTVFLGPGRANVFLGRPGHQATCHLPPAPSGARQSAVAYYGDLLLGCTVVSP